MFRKVLLVGSSLFFIVIGTMATANVGYAQSAPETEVQQNQQEIHAASIVGGRKANKAEFPAQASIRFSGIGHRCGGTLVAPQWVLTAGHCVFPLTPSQVILGAHNIRKSEKSTQKFSVSKVIIHPSFNPPATFNNDIALLKLSRPAKLTKWVQVATIASNSEFAIATSPNKRLMSVGWGVTSQSGTTPNPVLKVVSNPLISLGRCRKAYDSVGPHLPITHNMICHGNLRNANGACSGDSGGPLYLKLGGKKGLRQVGISSWRNSCDNSKTPAIFTRLPKYKNWVDNQIKKDARNNNRPNAATSLEFNFAEIFLPIVTK